MQPPGGVDDERIEHAAAGARERRLGDGRRRGIARGREILRVDLAREALELQHRGRPAHVGAREQHTLALALDQPACQLRGRSGLAGALQARQQQHRRRLSAQRPARGRASHEAHQLRVQ